MVTSSELVIGDPLSDIGDQSISVLGAVMPGLWQVFTEEPRVDGWLGFYVLHEDLIPVAEDLVWYAPEEEIGSCAPIFGIFDKAHFKDVSAFPVSLLNSPPEDPEIFWYKQVVNEIAMRRAVTVPFGFCVSWDSSVRVRLGRRGRQKLPIGALELCLFRSLSA